LSNEKLNEDINTIRKQYTLLTEDDTTSKLDLSKSVEDKIDSDTKPNEDKSQGYRISGGLLVLHGKNQTELELTTDEKLAFQETMDDFVGEVADLVDFNKLNIYPNNVEWSGRIIDADIEFFFSIGEENGVYINGDMIKTDNEFLEMVNKLKSFYEKFKSKWAAILADRKKTVK
jgi:hypothetical protein